MRYRSRLMTLSLVLALATASGCLSSVNQVKPPATRTQNVVGIGNKTLPTATLGGLVEMPSAQISPDGTKLAYALADISKHTPCAGAQVTVRDAQMNLAPNSDTGEKTSSAGKFTLKALPPDVPLYIVAQFSGVQLATIATASTKKQLDVTIDLASTLSAAGLLPLFVDKDSAHPAEFQLVNLSVPLYNDLVAAVEHALDDSTTTKPSSALKNLTGDFTTLMGQNASVKQAYDAIIGDLASKQTNGKGGTGGATPSPGTSATATPDASATATPGATTTATPTAQPTQRPPIAGVLAAISGAKIAAAGSAVEMLALTPPAVLGKPGMVVIPDDDRVLTVDTTGTVTTYDSTALGTTFSGASSLVLGGTATSPIAYMIATVSGAQSLITLDLVKLLAKTGSPTSVQSLQGQASGAVLGALAFDAANGKLYAVDQTNNTVDLIAPGGGQVSIYMGTGQAGASTSGAVTSFAMRQPTGIAIDGNTLYVVDSGNNRLLKADITANTATVLSGNASANPGLVDGTLTSARYDLPLALSLTSDKKLLVADEADSALREVDPTGDSVVSLEKGGASGGTNLLNLPVSVVQLGSDIYAIDGTGQLQKFTPN